MKLKYTPHTVTVCQGRANTCKHIRVISADFIAPSTWAILPDIKVAKHSSSVWSILKYLVIFLTISHITEIARKQVKNVLYQLIVYFGMVKITVCNNFKLQVITKCNHKNNYEFINNFSPSYFQ